MEKINGALRKLSINPRGDEKIPNPSSKLTYIGSNELPKELWTQEGFDKYNDVSNKYFQGILENVEKDLFKNSNSKEIIKND